MEYSLVIRRKLHRERLMLSGEGMAAGRPMRKRLTLGSESLKIIKEKRFETLICHRWEDVITSTDAVEIIGRKRRGQHLTSLPTKVHVFSDVFGLQNAEILSTHSFSLIIKQQLLTIYSLNLCA